MGSPKYSVIVPVYNRPEELTELLESLTQQTFHDFEVLIIEDGSDKLSDKVYEAYARRLSIRYFFKPNTGPGPSRNFGFERAAGEWLVVFDSDCIVPPGYFTSVESFMSSHPVDAWGGPDRGHPGFSALQQAMAFTMSSVITTGGIRGGKNQGDTFQPRSFNMGISRKVFQITGGFRFNRLAEDIELSIRMRKAGLHVALIREAFVYHKRRTSLKQFSKQVEGFGRGRVRVGHVHPDAIKVAHWFPTLFLLSLFILPVITVFKPPLGLTGISLLLIYFIAIFSSGWRSTGSFYVGLLSVPSAWVQLTGYGFGFLSEKFKRPASR